MLRGHGNGQLGPAAPAPRSLFLRLPSALRVPMAAQAAGLDFTALVLDILAQTLAPSAAQVGGS